MKQQTTVNDITFTRINNDINGNPRYVCHFLSFIGENETHNVTDSYNIALHRSRKLGGKKFHNKQYGGGIVFQSYNTDELSKQITEIRNRFNLVS